MKTDVRFRLLVILSVILAVLLLVGQSVSLFNYDLAISLGLQESIDEIGPVGISFAKGFAFGDTIFYLPMLLAGIIGMLKHKKWGFYAMFASLAVSVYWPIVHLYMLYVGKDIIALTADKYMSYSIILPIVAIYGLWGMWYLYSMKAE